MENKILVVDIESLGFQKDGGCIVEVGAVELDLDNGTIVEVFNSLVREDGLREKHRESDRYNWIFKNSSLTPEMVREAPSQHDVYPAFQKVVDKYPLGITAFNRSFDIDYL